MHYTQNGHSEPSAILRRGASFQSDMRAPVNSQLVPIHVSTSIISHHSPLPHTPSSSNLTILYRSRAFPAHRALRRLLCLSARAQTFLPNPSSNVLLCHHTQPMSTGRLLLCQRGTIAQWLTTQRWDPNNKNCRKAAGQLVMCMDSGAGLPGSRFCLCDGVITSVILGELFHFPMSQFPLQWNRIKSGSYFKGLV